MTRAIWNGAVLAESDDVVVADGYTYFPREAVKLELLVESIHTTLCPWKGRASYYTVVVAGTENRDAAWCYPSPKPTARQVEGRIAFWRGVDVVTEEEEREEREERKKTTTATAPGRPGRPGRPSLFGRLRDRSATSNGGDRERDGRRRPQRETGTRAGTRRGGSWV